MSTYVNGRIVLIGDTQVGKTSIVQRYLKGQSSAEQKSTIGAVFHTHETYLNNQKVSLQIWDTAGQERYKALGPIYYRKSNAAIAVFDLTQRNTMNSLADWIKTFRENADDTFVVIAANKSDLEAECQFTLEETMDWARQFGAECIWTSAVTGIGIDHLFNTIAQYFVSKNITTKNRDVEISDVKSDDSKGKCC